jgi:modification methylase
LKLNQLVKGNNIEVLYKLSIENDGPFVDCTITSPPYNKQENKNSGGITKAVKYDNYCDSLLEEDYQKQQIELLNQLWYVTNNGGHCFYNHKVRYVDGTAISPFEWINKSFWNVRQEIIWDRIIASNIRGWRYWNVDERIYWLYKPKDENDKGVELKSQWAKMGSIWRFPPEGKIKNHPAPYPTELPRRIIKSLYENGTGKVILDPYVGSGTTAVVAKELGHNYLGIDVSEEYLKSANQRINESSIQNCGLSELFGD